MLQAARYSSRKVFDTGIEVVQLRDAAHDLEVSIAPSVGDTAYELKTGGKNLLWFPYHSLAEFKENPRHCGIPFLAPWANRISGDAYYVNGKAYLLNPALGNLRRDNHRLPIHGVLNFSPHWTVASISADDRSASVTSRMEFWRHPETMAQFPFAHTITMTYRLQDGALAVETTLENHSVEAMPVAIGYHPYLQLHDSPRDEWKAHLAARDRLILNDLTIPTGERKPVEFADSFVLRNVQLDDVFTNLVRGSDGRAQFWVEGKGQKLEVAYGPKYSVAVVYAPAGHDFICFEPMAAVTDAFNLAHAGLYSDLQMIAPGGQWNESFWISPSGF